MKRLAVALLGLCAGSAFADDGVANFYRGKQINMYVGTAAGNDFGFRAELVARYMKKYLPGEPHIIIRYTPGAGGVIAANYLANVAPRDGTALLASQQNMPTLQAVGTNGVKFDATKFNWIGSTSDSANVITVWHTSGVQALDDAKNRDVSIGVMAGNASIYYMSSLNELVGTRFKAIAGYDGGNAVNLAMERGEVAGRSNSIASWNSTRPNWVAENKIRYLVQIGLRKDEQYPNIPLLMDLARNEFDREVLKFISADTAMARPIATNQDVPEARVAALRKAFNASVADPEFLAEAAKSKMDISVATGEQVQEIVNSIVRADPKIIARAKEFMVQK